MLPSTNQPIQPDHRCLGSTLSNLRRRFGDNAVVRLDDRPRPVEVISTGFPELDQALGVGGLPRGRISHIYSPESCGKTALCLSIIGQAHRRNLPTVFIDVDHALDPRWALRWGANPDLFYYADLESAERALEITREVIRGGAVVVVVDSTAALTPQGELSSEMGDVWTNHGKLMSDALRNLAGPVSKHRAVLIFTSQMRDNDRSVAHQPGPTGGLALRSYASIQIDLRRVEAIKRAGEITGQVVRATVKKNKVAPPFGLAEFNLFYEIDASEKEGGER
jgi:recombination protein RecA